MQCVPTLGLESVDHRMREFADRQNTNRHSGFGLGPLRSEWPVERPVGSIKESCLESLILFGENSLRTAVQNSYHVERNHQALGDRLIQPELDLLTNTGAVQRRERPGGMLDHYYRAAA
jgi:hypothetical protein